MSYALSQTGASKTSKSLVLPLFQCNPFIECPSQQAKSFSGLLFYNKVYRLISPSAAHQKVVDSAPSTRKPLAFGKSR